MLSPTQREKLHAAGFVALFVIAVTLAISASGLADDHVLSSPPRAATASPRR